MRLVLTILLLSLAPLPAVAQVRADDTPSFELTALDASSVSSEALRGKVVLVDFWATWCAPCKRALRTYETLQEEFGADRLQVVAISIDRRRKVTERFVKKYDLSLTFVWDDGQKLLRRWSPATIPTAYLLGPEGRVHRIYKGFDSDHHARLRADVRALLGGDS